MQEAKATMPDRRRFTSRGLDVIRQSSILVNKWWGQCTGAERRSKTLINYPYLRDETTFILVSRSGGKWAYLFYTFDPVGGGLFSRGTERWLTTHRKPIVPPQPFITALYAALHTRRERWCERDASLKASCVTTNLESTDRDVHIRSKSWCINLCDDVFFGVRCAALLSVGPRYCSRRKGTFLGFTYQQQEGSYQ